MQSRTWVTCGLGALLLLGCGEGADSQQDDQEQQQGPQGFRSEGSGRYLLSVGGTVDVTDYDALSGNEHCHESFLANIAIVGPDEPEGGHPVDFEQCDDGVQPIIDIHAELLDNGWSLVTGRVAMWSQQCLFNNTEDHCTWPGTGTFTITEVNEVMKPGDRLDIHGRGEHYNTVDFPELVLYYDAIDW